MPRRGLLLLLAASAPAFAQDAPDVAPASLSDVSPAAPAVAPVPLAERFVWERRTGLGRRVAAVAVEPVPGGAWVAVDEQGGVWLSEDEGRSWDSVVRPLGGLDTDDLPDDEALLLEAESRRDEALEASAEELEVATPADATEEDADLPEAPEPDDGALEEASVLGADLAGERADGGASLPVVWAEPGDGTRLFVGRADGVWRSTSSGRTWDHLGEAEDGAPAITCFARAADGALVVGTTDGVRYSVDDGGSFIDVEDATDGARVNSVVVEGGLLWAATSRGLFRSANGLAWDAIPLPDGGDVRAIVPDPAWDQGFWVASRGALHRTDDGGATFYISGRQPLRGLRTLVHLDEPGHLLATSDDGVWESMDGGVMWFAADRRLSEPDVRSLSFSDNGPVIATPGGVWRMVPPRESTRAVRAQTTLSLSDTIAAASQRGGMDIDLLSLSRAGVAAKLMPVLELKFDWDSSGARRASQVSASTTDSFDDSWSAGLQVCWGSCSGVAAVAPTGEADLDVSRELYVSNGQVYDEGEPVAAAANVATTIRSYRRYLAEHVADAWIARTRLVAESGTVRSLPLRDQVLHAVQLQELDARLDALTEGAFSKALRTSSPSEESK